MDEMAEAQAEVAAAFRDAVTAVYSIYGGAYWRYRTTAGRSECDPSLEEVQQTAAKLRKIASAF